MKYIALFGSACRNDDPCAALGPFNSKGEAWAAIDSLMGDSPGGLREDGFYGIFPIASSIEELRGEPFGVAWNEKEEA